MVVEDAHWIDPTSLEWLGRVIEWARAARVCRGDVPAGIFAGLGRALAATRISHAQPLEPLGKPR